MGVVEQRILKSKPPQAECPWQYGLLAEDIEAEGLRCESYGVMITDRATGQEHCRRHVTVSALDAASLLDMLARSQVSPVTLDDVLEDWLGR